MNNEIMIYGELNENKELAPVVFELISVASNLVEKLDNGKITVLVPAFLPDGYEKLKKELHNTACDELIIVNDEKLQHYSTQYYSHCAIEIIKERNPLIVLVGATNEGRDLAPKISTALGTGLTADCTGLDIYENNKLAATRPTFGGNLMATILCKNLPQMATVRPNVFAKNSKEYNKSLNLIERHIDLSNIISKIKICEINKLLTSNNNLSSAQIIVAGGRGMKNAEGFELIYKLCKLLKAAPGASRGAVDMKLAPQSIQIGQTGKTVTPKIYIACGISGAIQHTVGMNSSDVIIAINNNPKAKIFEISDYCIIGDAFEILSKWIQILEFKKGD